MAVIFKPENHSYQSIDVDSKINWISVTTLVSNFKQFFDAPAIAEKSSKNKRSKWHGIPPEEILAIWERESKRGDTLGSWYHDQREKDITEFETIQREGINLPVFKPVYIDGIKHAPEQRLLDGIYPEHFVYLKSAGICGQSDRVEVVNNFVSINDYKTNKKIDTESYKNWEGVSKMMTGPVAHLQDCHINHYSLQLSLYLYMIIKHNPRLKPGKLTIDHIMFEEQDKDKYGYPVYKTDKDGNFIIKDIKHYPLEYLKSEVIAIINYVHDNPQLIKTKKS